MHVHVLPYLYFRLIKEQQNDWKRHRWHKIKTKLLKRGLEAQCELITKLPDKALCWDITSSMEESINELMVGNITRQGRRE